MNERHAICIVVDGLRAAALGAYGNTSFPTPHLDALASRSAVVEWMWADSPRLDRFYRSVWQGLHACRTTAATEPPTLPQLLQQAGLWQGLLTDDPWLAENEAVESFDESSLFEITSDRAANKIEDTHLARFFSSAVEQLADWREQTDEDPAGSLFWLHTRGFLGPWDAPRSLRAEMLDEEDPPPPEFLWPPDRLCHVDDPDVLLMHRVAYAAQTVVLDACLGAFLQAVEQMLTDEETLVMLLGSRGFALGEHGSIGADCEDLFSEQLHVPWLLHVGGTSAPVARWAGLAQPADVGATLRDWLELKTHSQLDDGSSVLPLLEQQPLDPRQLAVACGTDGQLAARTPAWMLKRGETVAADQGPGSTVELYVKPDDRWECNNVAVRCPHVVELLLAEVDRFQRRCLHQEPLWPERLDAELITPTR